MKKKNVILVVITFLAAIQLLLYPLLKAIPAMNTMVLEYGIAMNNICLSIVSGFIFYLATVHFPGQDRRRKAVIQIKDLASKLFIRYTVFSDSLLRLFDRYSVPHHGRINLQTIDELISRLGNNEISRVAANDIGDFRDQLRTLIADINYTTDLIMSLKDYVSDGIFEKILQIKDPLFYSIEKIFSNPVNIAFILNYYKKYILYLGDLVDAIHKENTAGSLDLTQPIADKALTV